MSQRESHPIPDAELDSWIDSAEKVLRSIKGNQDIEVIFREMTPGETWRTLPEELLLTYYIRRGTCHYYYFADLISDRTGQKADAAALRTNKGVTTPDILKKTKFSSSYAFFVMASSIVTSCGKELRSKDQSKSAQLDASGLELVVGKGFGNDLSYTFSYYVDALFGAKRDGLIQNSGDVVA